MRAPRVFVYKAVAPVLNRCLCLSPILCRSYENIAPSPVNPILLKRRTPVCLVLSALFRIRKSSKHDVRHLSIPPHISQPDSASCASFLLDLMLSL